MRHNLQKQLGIHQLTPEVILSMNKPEAEVCNILEILGIFIKDTGRFLLLGDPNPKS